MGHNLKKAAFGEERHLRAMGPEGAQKDGGPGSAKAMPSKPAVAKAMAGRACQPGYFQRL